MSITYQAYEFRRSLMKRIRAVADWQTDILAGIQTANANTTRLVAANRVLHALELTHERPEFLLEGVGDTHVTEHVVTATAFGRLIRFVKADSSGDAQPKVLVVPGLAGHYATLVRGTVQTMLVDHDVYVADWHNARDIPVSAGRFGLDEYIEHLMNFLRVVGPDTHLLAVCQPAVASLAAAAVMAIDDDPCRPASLILLAGPVDTRVNPSRVSRVADRLSSSMLERTVIHDVPSRFAGRGRLVYPGFLQVSGFMAMDPIRHVRAFADLYRAHRRGDAAASERTAAFYREYFAVLDITAEFYLETAQRIFSDNDLPRGVFEWRGRQVDPSLISSALFTIEGADDEMCCPGQTEAAHALCTGIPSARKAHLLQDGVGHYGVFAGSTFDRAIYPRIRDFIVAVSDPDPVAESPAPGH